MNNQLKPNKTNVLKMHEGKNKFIRGLIKSFTSKLKTWKNKKGKKKVERKR